MVCLASCCNCDVCRRFSARKSITSDRLAKSFVVWQQWGGRESGVKKLITRRLINNNDDDMHCQSVNQCWELLRIVQEGEETAECKDRLISKEVKSFSV